MLQNWAWTYLSCTSPKGPIDNPYAPGFSAGGSSSGCAALIASGKADLAVGGDQTGSLRVVRIQPIMSNEPTLRA